MRDAIEQAAAILLSIPCPEFSHRAISLGIDAAAFDALVGMGAEVRESVHGEPLFSRPLRITSAQLNLHGVAVSAQLPAVDEVASTGGPTFAAAATLPSPVRR